MVLIFLLTMTISKSVLPAGEWTIAFVFLQSMIIAVIFSLQRSYAIVAFAPSSLCMESNALEKLMTNSVALRFFCMFSINDLVDIWNLWSWSISPKTLLISPKHFLNFWLDTVEKHGNLNLSSKGYVSVVLSDSKVIFLGEVEDAAFCPFLYCVLFIHSIA